MLCQPPQWLASTRIDEAAFDLPYWPETDPLAKVIRAVFPYWLL